jgi:hypothetical protein
MTEKDIESMNLTPLFMPSQTRTGEYPGELMAQSVSRDMQAQKGPLCTAHQQGTWLAWMMF